MWEIELEVENLPIQFIGMLAKRFSWFAKTHLSYYIRFSNPKIYDGS
jgi:hypothetical protein